MSIPNDLLARVMELSEADRSDLVRRLHLRLEPEGPERDPGYEEAWAREIEERVRRYEAGETESIPVEEVLAELRRQVQERRVPTP